MSKKKDVTHLAYTVFCCGGSDCSKHGSKDVCKALRHEVRDAGLKHSVCFIRTECTGRCKDAPVAIICNGCNFTGAEVCGAVWYRKLKPTDAKSIVEEHLKDGRPLTHKMFHPHDEE